MEPILTEHSNCHLEIKGWVENQVGGNVYLKGGFLQYAGARVQIMVMSQCEKCALQGDCRPRPLFSEGDIVGVKVDI